MKLNKMAMTSIPNVTVAMRYHHCPFGIKAGIQDESKVAAMASRQTIGPSTILPTMIGIGQMRDCLKAFWSRIYTKAVSINGNINEKAHIRSRLAAVTV